MLNLDTHILIHALSGECTPAERKLLASNKWGISAIVLWEISKLHQLGRISLGLDDPQLAKILKLLHVWPLDLETCQALDRLDFKSDPADEIIATTSLVHKVPLLTRDKKIKTSKIVPLAL